jgi:hypothetical protein
VFSDNVAVSGTPDDLEDDTVMEPHGADPFNSGVKSLMHVIQTEDEEAQQDAAHSMIQSANSGTIRRWSETKLANRKPLVHLPSGNVHLVDLEWTQDAQAILRALVERYTSPGYLGDCRVH